MEITAACWGMEEGSSSPRESRRSQVWGPAQSPAILPDLRPARPREVQPKRRPELQPYIRTQICRMRRCGLKLKDIYAHFPEIKYKTISATIARESTRVENKKSIEQMKEWG